MAEHAVRPASPPQAAGARAARAGRIAALVVSTAALTALCAGLGSGGIERPLLVVSASSQTLWPWARAPACMRACLDTL